MHVSSEAVRDREQAEVGAHHECVLVALALAPRVGASGRSYLEPIGCCLGADLVGPATHGALGTGHGGAHAVPSPVGTLAAFGEISAFIVFLFVREKVVTAM